jgi:hypothetical protein
MASYLSISLSLVLFSAGRHLRAANKPHANGALEGKGIWTNDDSERLSDYRPVTDLLRHLRHTSLGPSWPFRSFSTIFSIQNTKR